MVLNDFQIANDPKTPHDILKKLSTHKDRATVAINSRTKKYIINFSNNKSD